MTSIADLLAGPDPRAKADRTGMYRLYDNFIGIDDGVMTPGERLGAGINGLGSALMSDPVGAISGMALGVKDDLDDLMFRGGAERRPQDVLGYAAAPMAPGALRGRVANVVSAGGAKPKKGITAYHGSPHEFDRFSMDKIGTGEGAQAYGHGLYFAEAEDVAKAYRDALQYPRINSPQNVVERVADDLNYHRGSVDSVRSIYEGMIERGDEAAKAMGREKLAALPEAQKKFKGSMYEVRINADPDDFLDWDAPLSAQSPKVREGLEALDPDMYGPSGGDYDPMDPGHMIYSRLSNQARDYGIESGKTGHTTLPGSQAKATSDLSGFGVPGIKYRDAGSRGLDGQSGTRNFVVFDENLIEIVRKYGIAGAAAMLGISAQELQAQVDQQQSQKSGADEITDYLQSIGAQ